MKENVIVRPSYDPRGKMQIPNPYCTSAKHAQSYPSISIVYTWKCRCSWSDKLDRTKEISFLDPHLTPRDKLKIPKPYCKSTRHTQSYPRVSFVYSMKCRQSSCDNNFTKNIIFGPLFTPVAKMKIWKTFYASARHVRSDSRI